MAVAEGYLRRDLRSAIRPGVVLEVGAGTGTSAQAYGALGSPYICLDRSHGMLEVAASRKLSNSVLLVQADAADMPVSGGVVDTVLSWGALHHMPDWRGVVSEIARVLVPGGRLVVREPNPRYPAQLFAPLEAAIEGAHRIFDRSQTTQPPSERGDLGDTSPVEHPFALHDLLPVALDEGLELERATSPMFLASLGVPDDLFGGLRGYYEAAYLADRFIERSTRHQRGALWTASFTKTSTPARGGTHKERGCVACLTQRSGSRSAASASSARS
ncbi:MAG: class I SAM-dependent methyltransferase [Candidatus Saccharibacteria bacterium]|nr:class I SAM-dependent methyltransferase [Microbacteriaceae bacterium]